MSPSTSAARSSSLRVLLRVSLLAGAIFDLSLAVLLLAGTRETLGPTGTPVTGLLESLGDSRSYAWLLAPALAARAGIQGLACYDRQRYDDAIWLAGSTFAASAVWGLLTGHVGAVAALAGLIGGVQLLAWKVTRG